MSNQAKLANGCVCDSGCEACGRLAEAFTALRAVVNHVEVMGDDAYLSGHPEWEAIILEAQSALDLARGLEAE